MSNYLILLPDGKYVQLIRGGSFETEPSKWQATSNINEATVQPKTEWNKRFLKYGQIQGHMLPATVTRTVTITVPCGTPIGE